MGSRSGAYKTPCPNCEGEVKYFWYDSDCRGNPGGGGIQCKQCEREFTVKEWQILASDEMKEIKREERLRSLGFTARRLNETVKHSSGIIEKLESELFSGKDPANLDSGVVTLHKLLLDYANGYRAVSEA